VNILNNTTDVEKYLQSGPMTQPFLNDPALDKKMEKASSDKEKVEILLKYMHKKNKTVMFDKKYIRENKFGRTAEEIWQSGKMTGCTDWSMAFASIARQYGISTSFFTTAEKGWAENILNGKMDTRAQGHSFCESFIDGQWQLVDATFSKIQKEYDVDSLHLTAKDHFVAGKKDFIPFLRDLDIGHRSNTNEFVNNMVDSLYKMKEQESEAVIEPVTREELIEAGFKENEEEIEIIKYDNKENSLNQEKEQD